MGNLANTIPFTELYERLLTMASIDSPNNTDFAKGVINDVYTRSLPRTEDWSPIINTAYLSMVASYSTGTVSVNAAATAVTGVGTVWTSGMTATDGYKIKFAGNDNIYTFTYVSGTTGTISPALSGATNLSGVTYTIYKDDYELVSTFSRFLKNGSIYTMTDGKLRDIIGEYPHDLFRTEYRAVPKDPIERCILGRTHATNATRLVRVNPPPKTAKVYPYDYIERITPMTDYSTGTVAVTNGAATIVGTDTLWSTNAAAGDYFRIDGNGEGDSSKWYQIQSVDTDTGITLTENFGENTESGMEYTISKAPTAYPYEFHEYILYEAAVVVLGEQGDSNLEGFALRRTEILIDLKKNYKSRRTNVQFGLDDDGYR